MSPASGSDHTGSDHTGSDHTGSDHTGSDDRALLAAHVEGDPDAFGVLVGRHRDRLWAVALRTVGDREDAADGLQEGLVAAYRRAGSFRGDAAVTTWLHRVVVNACLDRIRARRVRDAQPLPTGEDADRLRPGPGSEGSGLMAERADGDPEVGAVRGEQRRRVLDALATLPPEQRAALVLVDMEGYAVAEAAEILDCAPGTVKSRCSRGRRRLAELLEDLVGPPDDGNREAGRDVEEDGRSPSGARPGARREGPPGTSTRRRPEEASP